MRDRPSVFSGEPIGKKACRSRRRRSSNLKMACLHWAAALAPGPRWASLSIRQIAWALTTATLVARLVSPITVPRRPSASPSHPRARPILAHLASAKHLSRLWRSEDRSPQGPATNLPSSNPPRDLNLETRGPGFSPAGAARNRTSRSCRERSYSAGRRSARRSAPFPAVPRGYQVLPALTTFSSARQFFGPSGVGRRNRKSGTFPCLALAI